MRFLYIGFVAVGGLASGVFMSEWLSGEPVDFSEFVFSLIFLIAGFIGLDWIQKERGYHFRFTLGFICVAIAILSGVADFYHSTVNSSPVTDIVIPFVIFIFGCVLMISSLRASSSNQIGHDGD